MEIRSYVAVKAFEGVAIEHRHSFRGTGNNKNLLYSNHDESLFIFSWHVEITI